MPNGGTAPHNDRRPLWARAWQGYLLAVLVTIAAAAIRSSLPHILGETPFLAFYPGVVIAAVFGGMGPGLLATVLGAIAVAIFYDPSHEGIGSLTNPLVLARLGFFIAGGAGLSMLAGRERRARVAAQQQAEALQRSEARLKATFENAGVGIVEVADDDHFINVNKRACEILGRGSSELLAMNVHELTWAEDRAKSDEVNAAIHGGNRDQVNYEKRYIRGDGSPVWANVTVSAVRNSRGQWIRSITTIEDISQRKKATEELLRSEQRFRGTFENAAVGMSQTDINGRWTLVNQRLCDMLGYPRDEMLRMGFRDATHPEDADEDWRSYRQMIRGETEGYRLEKRYVRKDGSVFWTEIQRSLQRDQQGKPAYSINIVIDISDRKRAQEALRQSETRYRLLFERNPDAVFALDLTGRFVLANEACQKITGFALEEFCRKSLVDLVTLDQLDALVASFKEVVANHRSVQLETSITRADGRRAELWLAAEPIVEEDQTRAVHCTAKDITQRKTVEETLQRTIKELATQRARWQGLVQSMVEEVWTCDAAGKITLLNRGTFSPMNLIGFEGQSIEEVVEEVEVLDPDGQPRPAEQAPLLRSLRGEVLSGEEIMRHRRTGVSRWRQYTSAPLRDDAGQIIGAVTVVRDITEMTRVQNELRHSEAKFRAVFEQAAIGMGRVNFSDARWIDVNDAFCRMLGYPREHMLSTPWPQMTHPDDIELDMTDFRRMARGELDSYSTEKRFAHKDGHYVWAQLTLSLVRDASGKPAYEIAIIEDITDRKRTEEALRHSEAQFRQLADSMPQIVWASRPDGVLDYYNRRWYELTGAREGAIGDQSWLPVMHPDDRQRCLDLWYESVRTGKPYHIEYRFNFPAIGEYRWHLGRALPARDENGGIIRWYGTCTDIHDVKHAQEQLRLRADEVTAAQVSAERAKAAAEEANRAKDHFLAVLSHELRNPLTPVLTTATVLHEDQSLPEDVHHQLEVIRRNAELEARLIDDLLDITRISRGKIELYTERVELCSVVARAIEVCQPDLDGRQIHFSVDWGNRPYWIDADVGRLQQVFWNLLKNAAKFTPHGGCVGVKCHRHEQMVTVEVIDSGIGIEPDRLPLIFGAFQQADRTITRQFGGLGLGLAISKSLVELHGGEIGGDSEGKGKGARFWVRLPLQVAPDQAPARGVNDGQVRKAASAARPLRILLVEDHGDTARIMQRLLRNAGHEVALAGDVATAIETAGTDSFDLLISDLGLPDGSGLDLLRRLRGNGNAVRAIALSGYGQEEDLQRSREAGFSAHLIKPTSPEHLRETIARVSSSV